MQQCSADVDTSLCTCYHYQTAGPSSCWSLIWEAFRQGSVPCIVAMTTNKIIELKVLTQSDGSIFMQHSMAPYLRMMGLRWRLTVVPTHTQQVMNIIIVVLLGSAAFWCSKICEQRQQANYFFILGKLHDHWQSARDYKPAWNTVCL